MDLTHYLTPREPSALERMVDDPQRRMATAHRAEHEQRALRAGLLPTASPAELRALENFRALMPAPSLFCTGGLSQSDLKAMQKQFQAIADERIARANNYRGINNPG